MSSPYKLLQIALVIFGAAALLIYPLVIVWPSGWAWHEGAPHTDPYLVMIVGVYAVLGIFLIRAARKPEDHVSLIWFTVWSSLAHGAIMAAQSFGHLGAMGGMSHTGHLVGDVPTILLGAVLVGFLTRAAKLNPPPRPLSSSS